MPDLYPHQLAAQAAVLRAVAGGAPSGLVVIPTGGGKTALALDTARRLGVPAAALVHRDELARQWVESAAKWWRGARVGVVQGDRDEWAAGEDLVVASVPTLHVRRRVRMPRDRFGLVIADECHHATDESTWGQVLDYFQAGFLLGVTATPQRLDGRPLTRFGSEPLYTYSIAQAIKDGKLVQVVSRAIQTDVDLDDVHTRGGDLAAGELAAAVNTPGRNRIVVDAYLEHAGGRRGIVFAVDVAHAEALAAEFDAALVPAAVVTGSMPIAGRRASLEAHARGGLQVLVNCEVLTEGYDDPGVSCVVWARPTKSRTLYVQGTGRGLRLAPGKTDCLVLDITDNCHRHKLVVVADLLGRPKKEPGEPREVREGGGGRPKDVREPVEWCLKEVCPWPELPTLEGYVAYLPWHGQPASEGQLRYLRSFGLAVKDGLTKGEASYLIDRAGEYEAAYPLPATSKQRWCLREAGLWVEGMSKREAGRLITELKGAKREAS